MSSLLLTRDERPHPGSDESCQPDRPHHRLHQLSKKPLSFWFLNQWLEEHELSRQIHELKEKGFGGFFLHPRGGLEVPYGSRRWYEVIGHCIREAARLGLEAWLYDEDPYPSGAAGGQVTLENPSLRAMELVPCLQPVSETGEQVFDLPPGMLHSVYLIDTRGIRVLDEDAGIVRTQWRQGMRANSYYPPYQDQGTPHWRAETHSPHFRVVTHICHAPATLLAFVKVPIVQAPWGDYPDLLNKDAVDAFIRLTHERYYHQFAPWFGGVVPGIFTDESKLRGNIPWSASLDTLLMETGGITLRELLPHLILSLDAQTPWFRWLFRETLARGFLSAFGDRVQEACRSRGLLWTGHFSPEEDPVTQVLYVPGLFRLLTRMDIPGTDLIGASLGDNRYPLLCLSPKFASSAAHIAGKPYTGCEALAVTDWVQDFDFITRTVHWLFALGVNRIVIHGQYYSIDGPRKREAPPSQFYQAAGWAHMEPLSRQIALLSDYLSRGTHSAPVLLYYPEETFMVHARNWDGSSAADLCAAEAQRDKLGQLTRQLLTGGYDFDFVDAEHLQKVEIRETGDGPTLFLTTEVYQVILVPGTYLTESTSEHLSMLQERGAKVWFIEGEVTILSRTPRKVTPASPVGQDALARLKALFPPLWQADHAFLGHLRTTDGGPLLFLCNNTGHPFHGTIRVAFPGPYEVCHPAIGEWLNAGSSLELELPTGAGVLIRPATQPRRLSVRPSQWRPLKAVWSPWRAIPAGENCLLLHEFPLVTRPTRAEGATRSDAALPPPRAFFNAPVVDLASPASLHANVPHGTDRYLLSTFEWSGPIAEIKLVVDSDLMPVRPRECPPEKLFYVNGVPLPKPTRRRTFDPMNQEYPLTDFLHEGRNTLLWVQPGTTGALPYDGIRLFGNFHAERPFSRSFLAKLFKRPEYYLCGEPVSPDLLGHGHFPGVIEYACTVTLSFPLPARVALRFLKVYESMEVLVNGSSAGHLWMEPYLLEVDRALLRPGANELLLRCATSPANYLLGLHRPAGCLGPVEWCGID